MRKSDPGDLKKKFFRSDDRFFQINGQWYFSAREGEIGPFRNREQARLEAKAYIVARQTGEAAREGRMSKRWAEPTVIPGYVYRSVLSMAQQVNPDAQGKLVLDLDDIE